MPLIKTRSNSPVLSLNANMGLEMVPDGIETNRGSMTIALPHEEATEHQKSLALPTGFLQKTFEAAMYQNPNEVLPDFFVIADKYSHNKTSSFTSNFGLVSVNYAEKRCDYRLSKTNQFLDLWVTYLNKSKDSDSFNLRGCGVLFGSNYKITDSSTIVWEDLGSPLILQTEVAKDLAQRATSHTNLIIKQCGQQILDCVNI